LNKRKIREVEKYLVRWKGFMAESDTWERKEDFKGRMNAEVRRQEKIDMAEERDFRRGELLGKYIAKLLYEWDNKKFENEYLKKLEKNWKRWKNDRQIDENEHLKSIEEKMKEENEKIRNKDWKIGYFSRREILKGG